MKKTGLAGLIGIVVLTVLAYAGKTWAFGLHEGLDCLGCHSPHFAKAQKLLKVDNQTFPNPRTGKPVSGVSALCLGCHNLPEYGGAGATPIYSHMTHPINVVPNPKIAMVPPPLLREGTVECVSCHDPHPSNPNWKYLRTATVEGGEVGRFCSVCHPGKVDKNFYGDAFAAAPAQIFTSMNETAGPGAFAANDANLVTSNPTPVYVQPYGDYTNSLDPVWETVPQADWYLEPTMHRVPADLKTVLRAGNKAKLKEKLKAQKEERKMKQKEAPAAPAN